MVKVPWCEGKSAAGSCGRSARSEEDGDPGDLLLAKEKANDKADGLGTKKAVDSVVTLGSKLRTAVGTKKRPSPKGLRAASGRLRGERGATFLERPRVIPSAPGA